MNDLTTPPATTTPTALPTQPPSPGQPPTADIDRVLGLDTSGAVRRWVVRGIWLAVAAAALVGALLGIKNLTTPKPIDYLTQPVKRGDLTLTVTATGTLEPRNMVQVGSELSGRVDGVFVDFNDTVTLNQPLAKLDTELLAARVKEAEAQLKMARAGKRQAEATVAEATANLGRLEPLKQQGITTEYDFDAARAAVSRAEAAVETADAQIASAEAALEMAKTNVAHAVIRAPIAGIVLKRNIEPGQSVVSSLQAAVVFELAEDLKRMELHLDIDEADVGRVSPGQSAVFTVAAYPEREFSAIVIAVRNAPATLDNVVTYEAILRVDNDDLALRPGMTATAEITTDVLKNVLLAPNAALRFSPPARAGVSAGDVDGTAPGTRVWIMRDGQPTPITVGTGATGGSFTVITSSDLDAGTNLLTGTTSSTGTATANRPQN